MAKKKRQIQGYEEEDIKGYDVKTGEALTQAKMLQRQGAKGAGFSSQEVEAMTKERIRRQDELINQGLSPKGATKQAVKESAARQQAIEESNPEMLIRKKIESEQQEKAIRAQVAEEQKTPEQKALETKQAGELQKTTSLIAESGQPNKPRAEREAIAGLTAISQVASHLPIVAALEAAGIPRATPQEMAQDAPFALLGRGINLASGTKIWGISLNTLFSGYGRDVKKNTQDAHQLANGARAVATTALKGGDLDNSIAELNVIESAVTARYAEANFALENSPQDIADGLDLRISMALDLQKVQLRRQALERYKESGNAMELMTSLGNLETMEATEAQNEQ